PPSRRRSKEEYLDALANLLERKRAYTDAAETVRHALVRDLEQFLGLPAGTPIETLAAQVARSRESLGWSSGFSRSLEGSKDRLKPELQPTPLLRALTADFRHLTAEGFLRTLHELEAIRHDFFLSSRAGPHGPSQRSV